MFIKSSVSAGSNTQFWSFTVRAGSKLVHDLDLKMWYENLEHDSLATDLFTDCRLPSTGIPISLCYVMNAVVWLAISLAKMYYNVPIAWPIDLFRNSLPIVSQAYSIEPNQIYLQSNEIERNRIESMPIVYSGGNNWTTATIELNRALDFRTLVLTLDDENQ